MITSRASPASAIVAAQMVYNAHSNIVAATAAAATSTTAFT
jgi:hypothetical protein